MNWYLEALNKYAVFNGRARRKEYWMFFLFNVIITIVLAIIDAVLGTMVLAGIYTLGVIVPNIAVTVRRLHDTGRTGWWILVGFIPAVGALILLVFMLLDGMPATNKFGPSPK